MNDEFIRLLKLDNWEKLPVIYKVMEPVSIAHNIKVVESEFHQTKIYECFNFSKPISRMKYIL